MDNISQQEIRKTMAYCLAKSNHKEYSIELLKLEKAKSSEDLVAINESEQKILELAEQFEFDKWIEDFVVQKVIGVSIASHSSKGIHTSARSDNINYLVKIKPNNQQYISSATPAKLPFDCTGNAAKVTSVFTFLNQEVKNGTTLLQLIMQDHPAVLAALSDDNRKAELYLSNLKKVIVNDFKHPKSSELNKQFFWPNSESIYLSPQENNYRLLIPLYPSSLCHLVYQKIQTRYSDENKQAKYEQSHFSFKDLAVVKLGGTKPLNVGQLNQFQQGKNFLLPSMPPKFDITRQPSISKQQESIFNQSLRYYCRLGFNELFDAIKAPKNVVGERELRKEAFAVVLTLLLKFAKHIQTTMPAGWSRDYQLSMTQQYWLDPKRADLDGETDFKAKYEQGNWLNELEQQFAFWINSILKEKFKNISEQFADPEFREWRREFGSVVKASQRKKERIF